MKAARFEYARAESLNHALEILDAESSNVKVMAGSQSLGPLLNLRLARPRFVIDISSLSILRSVSKEGSALRIGAGVTHAEIEDGVYELLRGHPWQTVAAAIAYRSIRNRGTVGGSIAHADPAADWVLAATAMSAVIEIASKHSTRHVPMTQFMQAAYTTVLEDQEVVTAIHIPMMSDKARWGYFKFCRKVGEFAEASCAAYFDPASQVANLVVGALDGAPKSLAQLAEIIAKEGWPTAGRDTIVEYVSVNLASLDVLHQKMLVTVISRCLDRAFNAKGPA